MALQKDSLEEVLQGLIFYNNYEMMVDAIDAINNINTINSIMVRNKEVSMKLEEIVSQVKL